MTTPLIRQGEGLANSITRIHHQRQAERAALERNIALALTVAINDTKTAGNRTKRIGHRSSEGDRQRLRAIPCIAEGITGTIPGTQPLHALLDQERRTA